MATTTNYNWSTPDDTSLVKDGAAAIRTLGSSIDTTTKALNPSTTLGDIEYRSSTANTNTRLAIGSTGQVLTVAGGVPSWATPAGGGGKVLQVIQSTYGTQQTSSSTTYADTNLSATITPSATSSKILVLTSFMVGKTAANTLTGVYLKLLFGSTDIVEYTYPLGFTLSNLTQYQLAAFNYLHSPNTTSATTYKVQFKNNNASAAVEVFPGNTTGTMILMEIGA